MPVNPALLEEDLELIRKRRGERSVRMADELIEVEKIPFQSPTLMRITTGGLAIGRAARFVGEFSSGKTHTAYLAVAAAQAYRSERFPDGLQCRWWDVEGVFDEPHARYLGIDTAKLPVDDEHVIEEIAIGIEAGLRSSHLHVVDSTSSATSMTELAAEPGDSLPMLQARAWAQACDHIEARMDKDENTIIFISHVSERVNLQTRQTRRVINDGKRLQHFSSLNIDFKPGAWLWYHPDGYLEKGDKLSDEIKKNFAGSLEPDGFEVTVHCTKNRTGRQHLVGKMRFDLNTFKFDTTFELLDAATYFDQDGVPYTRSGQAPIIYKTGDRSSWYMLPDGRKVQGKPGIRAELEKNTELAALVRTAMLAGN